MDEGNREVSGQGMESQIEMRVTVLGMVAEMLKVEASEVEVLVRMWLSVSGGDGGL